MEPMDYFFFPYKIPGCVITVDPSVSGLALPRLQKSRLLLFIFIYIFICSSRVALWLILNRVAVVVKKKKKKRVNKLGTKGIKNTLHTEIFFFLKLHNNNKPFNSHFYRVSFTGNMYKSLEFTLHCGKYATRVLNVE